MPLKINIGASKKVGEVNYGSRGASVNLELELESALVNDPPKLQDRIRQLFGLVRLSLAEELNGNGNGNGNGPSSHPTHDAGHEHHNGGNGNGNGSPQRSNPPRPATQSQVKAIYAITRAQGLNVHQVLRDRFNVGKPEELSIKEASQLIDSLKSNQQKGG
jgi:hypothetical protein